MKILVIAAMHSELKELIRRLGAEKTGTLCGMDCFFTPMARGSVHLVLCGVGKVNAAAISQQAISSFRPDLIINTGIAGSMHRSNSIGDIIIGRELTYHDVRRGQMKHCFPYQSAFYPDEWIIRELRAMVEESWEGKARFGKIVSGERFIKASEEKERIQASHTPDCVDMESAALAHTAFINHVPFVAIRSICDHADEDSFEDFSSFEKEQADLSARFTRDAIMRFMEQQAHVPRLPEKNRV